MLISRDTADRDAEPGCTLGVGHAEASAARAHVGQEVAGQVEQREQLVRPGAGGEVVEQGARGVRRLSRVDAAACTTREVPEDPAVDGAERERSCRAVVLAQDPGELRRREVGVEQQPRPRAHEGFVAGGAEVGRDRGGAPVLPHDGRTGGLAGRPVPDDRRLPLVGDADGRDRPLAEAGCHGSHGGGGRSQDLGGVVLDPPWVRVVLRQLTRRVTDRPALGVECDRADPRGAGVDREQHRRFGRLAGAGGDSGKHLRARERQITDHPGVRRCAQGWRP